MNRETSKTLKILCILSFVIVAITSIPLLVTYLKGISPQNPFIVDAHVWAGTIFIIIAIIRMIKTKLRKKSKTSNND